MMDPASYEVLVLPQEVVDENKLLRRYDGRVNSSDI